MVYKRQLDFKHSYPSGCDTSKLLSDDLENKLYYDGFQKMLYHYSHQTEAPNLGSGLFVWSCGEEDLNRATALQRRGKLSCGQFASLRENPFIRTKEKDLRTFVLRSFLFAVPNFYRTAIQKMLVIQSVPPSTPQILY